MLATPDGKMEESEWCMIDEKDAEAESWGYCDKYMNYDKIREKVKSLIDEEIPEMRKISDE
jgi:hypothetical protein